MKNKWPQFLKIILDLFQSSLLRSMKKIIKYVQLRHLQWPVCRGVALGTAGKGRGVPTSVAVTACRTTNSCQYLNSVVLPQLKQFQTWLSVLYEIPFETLVLRLWYVSCIFSLYCLNNFAYLKLFWEGAKI